MITWSTPRSRFSKREEEKEEKTGLKIARTYRGQRYSGRARGIFVSNCNSKYVYAYRMPITGFRFLSAIVTAAAAAAAAATRRSPCLRHLINNSNECICRFAAHNSHSRSA
ncbi:hypothetical protein K0M31_008624 [Melipona bicolor]|uniref:Uncharacterized protein n=1 Tax=Melipona bicolor TaxID=60889 RepID=A0AA40KK44_9HYME|nr:hypothetical protein K0M31_008624 [Melipona bicolor]